MIIITKLKHWLPAIIWAGFIFYLSSLQGVSLPAFPYYDKIAHLSLYLVLGYFVMMAIVKAHDVRTGTALIVCMIIVTVYGLSDELHQTFVPTRTAEVFDVLSDIFGGALGALIYGYKFRYFKKG